MDLSKSSGTQEYFAGVASVQGVSVAPASQTLQPTSGPGTDIQNAFAGAGVTSGRPPPTKGLQAAATTSSPANPLSDEASSDASELPSAEAMQSEWNELLAQACGALDPTGKFTPADLNRTLSRFAPSGQIGSIAVDAFDNNAIRAAWSEWMAKAPDDLDTAIVFGSDTMNLALSFFMAETNSESTKNAQQQITTLAKLVKERSIQMQSRLDASNAKAEKRAKMTIWQKIVKAIASLFTVIASACAVALAGPAALPLLAVSIAMLGMDIANLAGDSNASLESMLMKFGVPEKIATWLAFGLELAISIGVGAGAGALAKGGMKAAATSGNALLKSAFTETKLVQAATTIRTASTAVSAASTMTSGGMTVGSTLIKYDADMLQAEAKGDQAEIDKDSQFQQYVLQCFKQQVAASQKSVSIFSACNAEANRTSAKIFA
jgi:hypothetical protein